MIKPSDVVQKVSQYMFDHYSKDNGKLLVLGTYVLESDSISKQRFYFKEVGK